MKEYSIHLRWAFFFLGTCLTWQVIERYLGWHETSLDMHFQFRIIHFPIIAIMYYLAFLEFLPGISADQEIRNYLFTNGLILTLIICLFLPFTLWLLYNYISPEYLDNLKEYKMNIEGIKIKTVEHEFNAKALLTKIPFLIALEGICLSFIYSEMMAIKFKNSPG